MPRTQTQTQTLCHGLALAVILGLLLWPADSAHARSKTRSKVRAQLVKYQWVGAGASRGGSPLSLELKFHRRATRANLSVFWPRYQKYTARKVRVKVSSLPRGKGLRIKDRFTDGHPIYRYKSSTGVYCHIPTRDFLRSYQFRCKVQYSGWIVMHRKGVKVRSMAGNPPARPPSLKRNPRARPPRTKRSPAGSRRPTSGRGVVSVRRKTSVVGCWMKSILHRRGRRIVRSLLLTSKGRYRWIRGGQRRKQTTTRGRYRVSHGTHLLLLNAKGTRGTRWRLSVTRCIRRRPHQPCLQLHRPQAVRRTRRGKIKTRGRPRKGSHLFFRVGTHPKCR